MFSACFRVKMVKTCFPFSIRYTPGIYRTGGITLLNGISDPVPPLLFPLKVVHDRNQAAPLQHTVAKQRLVDSGLTSGVYDLFPILQCVSPLHSEGHYYHRFVVDQHGTVSVGYISPVLTSVLRRFNCSMIFCSCGHTAGVAVPNCRWGCPPARPLPRSGSSPDKLITYAYPFVHDEFFHCIVLLELYYFSGFLLGLLTAIIGKLFCLRLIV